MVRAIFLAAAIAGLSLPAAAQEAKSFKDWTATCDNTRTCTAFGYTDEGGDADAFIRLFRAAGPDAALKITLRAMTYDNDDGKAPLTWRVAVDDKAVPGLPALVAKAGDGERRADLTPAQSLALAGALRNGATLTVSGGKAPIVITLAGSSAAMLWIDDRQGRVGTVTAIAARGAKPASAVPAAPGPPVVQPAPAVSQAGLPKKLPKALAASKALKDCDGSDTRGFDPVIARLGPNQMLWGVPCSAGAYNVTSILIISDDAGHGAREITPPSSVPADKDADNELMNIDYDAKTRILSSFSKSRGIGDCGDMTRWVWDGKAFKLLDEAVMGDCRGVPSDDWPSFYRAVVAR